MISLPQLRQTVESAPATEYHCQENLNLYSSPELASLATQALAGRQLKILSFAAEAPVTEAAAIRVCLCEDDYPGWLAIEDLDLLELAETPYQPIALSESDVRARTQAAIAYTHSALSQPNRYLWGGTVPPHYDCSGLMQSAFVSAGVWIPRDAYQQAAYTRSALPDTWLASVPDHLPETWFNQLESGDLIFFGSSERITHVGLYLGDGYYIHSSGKHQGRNGIGIDSLRSLDDPVSHAYFRQLRGAGRVLTSYQPTGMPMK